MKVSFVSSQAISKALQYQTQKMTSELTKAQKEVQTLRVADVGLALGARAGISASLNREVSRLGGLVDTNQLAASRLDSTQVALQELSSLSNELMSALTTAISTAGDTRIVENQATSVLSAMTAILNTNFNGEYIFAGINTDVKPFSDFLDPGSPNRVAFENEFNAFTFSNPITAGEMNAFLDTIETMFTGTGWEDWSKATNEEITSRISLTETAKTSVSANITGIKELAKAAATVAMLAQQPLEREAREALLERALNATSVAATEFAKQQGYVGVTQKRLEEANERMTMQIDLFTQSITDLEGIDPYEASSKVTSLMTQIEISYSLTARMQQMSLLKYLS
jgi:flagellar hook-associated protein 3 FlgL